MGRLALGAALRSFAGASVVFLSATSGWAQVPPAGAKPGLDRQPAGEALPPQPPPPPAAEPAPAPAKPAPPVAPAPAPAKLPPPAPAPAAEPPLDLPKNDGPPKRPAFLKTREEMERIKPSRSTREGPPVVAPAAPAANTVPKDFVVNASPWVDFTLTSFYMENRVGNFLNLGVQFGGYVFERMRVAGRFVVPLEDVNDELNNYDFGYNGDGSFRRRDARSMSVLYAASVGLLVTNSKTFVFGPSIELQRTDVEAYGTTLAFGLPFEWTTRKNMRIGFELAIGHAFGGSSEERCTTFTTPPTSCGNRRVDREPGTTVLFQYYMGWSLGGL